MPIHIIVAAAAISVSVPLLWASVSSGAVASGGVGILGRRRRGGEMEPDMHRIDLERSAGDRLVRPAVESIAARVRSLTPSGWVRSLERRAKLAGGTARTTERAFAAKLVALGIGALAVLAALRSQRPTVGVLFALVVVGFAYFAPDLLLNSRAKERQNTIRLELPDTLDQMMISVEAGLGFEAALARAGKAGNGPLSDEIIFMLQEMQVGVPRRQALHNLANRTDVPDLRNFVFAVVQSEAYGLPIAQTLRVQASELRDKRRQSAEERAFKIPVKIVFPLVLCIFPSLFIVLLGPAALRMWDALVGS